MVRKNSIELTPLDEVVLFFEQNKNIHNKEEITKLFVNKFNLIRKRKVYFNKKFAIRFSSSKNSSFSNCITCIGNIKEHNDIPFFSCLVSPNNNKLQLMNATLIRKVSHSSTKLTKDNLKGTILGNDILPIHNDLTNSSENFSELMKLHAQKTWDENIERIVSNTHNIKPTKKKFDVTKENSKFIYDAPNRAINFQNSESYKQLLSELDTRTNEEKENILMSASIENVKVKGMLVEYLISSNDTQIKNKIKNYLQNANSQQPEIFEKNELGDYNFDFPNFKTSTDIKAKDISLNSQPKGFNLDKFLEFLSIDKSVFLFYFVNIDIKNKNIKTKLVSVFDPRLIDSFAFQPHWAGRSMRGTAQLNGKVISEIISTDKQLIDIEKSNAFIKKIINIESNEQKK